MRVLAFAVALVGALVSTAPAQARPPMGCLPAALRAAVARVQRACGGLTVISTFRRHARIAGTRKPSWHASCRAVDFSMRSAAGYRCALRVLAGWPGGLSTDWARVWHVHVDTGRKVRFVHGGRRSRYAKRARQRGWGG